MANDFVTISDMLADALDLSGVELSEIRDAAPLMGALPAVASSNGTQHKYSVDTARPVVGFRSENAGRDFDKSAHRIDSVELKILDFSWAVDKAVAEAWRSGGASAFIAREGLQHLKAALFTLEQQFIYGTDNNADGFNGLADSAYINNTDYEMVVNAGGSSGDVQTSAYFLRFSDRECSMVMRGDGVVLGDTMIQNFNDGSGKNYPAYYTPACTWAAATLGAKHSVARLCNIEGSLTDDMIYDVLAKFPAGGAPNLIVMHKESQELLRQSRTATNTVGAPAPMVESVAGIRILTTDAIRKDEAVVS